jgi:hypothetical protein
MFHMLENEFWILKVGKTNVAINPKDWRIYTPRALGNEDMFVGLGAGSYGR